MTWKDLTIEQAQNIYSLNKSIVDEHTSFEAQVAALSYLTDTPEDEVNNWSIDRFKKELSAINFIYQPLPEEKPKNKFKVKGQRYRVSYNMAEVSYGQYLEVMEFSKGEDYIVENLHKIMASITFPVNLFGKKIKKDHSKVSEDMKKAPFILCHSVAVFFSQVYNGSLKIIQPYLTEQLTAKGMNQEQAGETVQALLAVMDGFTPQRN